MDEAEIARCASQRENFFGLTLTSLTAELDQDDQATQDDTTKIEFETDTSGLITAIIKSNNCFKQTYSVKEQSTYMTMNIPDVTSDNYSAYYSYKKHERVEEQKISSWFEWQRVEELGQNRLYTASSENLDVFVPFTMFLFYFVTVIIALLILCLFKVNWCCKVGKVKYYGADLVLARQADEAAQVNLKANDLELSEAMAINK